MRPKTITFTMAVLDADALKTAAAIGGAGALTLNGALASTGFDVARRVAFISAGDDSGDTFTIVGTNRSGNALTEVVTGANTGTAVSTENFKTVTSITASGASAGNVTIGTYSTADTAWYPVDHVEGIVLNITLSSGAAFTYTVQTTNSNVFSSTYTEGTMTAFDEYQGVSSHQLRIDHACRAVRLQITNWTSASDTATIEIVVPREV